MNSKVKTLFVFGAYLPLAGLVGYLSNPEKAQTALISGSFFGALSLLSAFLLWNGKRWALGLGVGVCGLLSVVFGWRASVSWISVANGNSEKTFAAALISSMLIAALISLYLLIRKDSLKS